MIVTEMLIVVAAILDEGVDARRCMSRIAAASSSAKFPRSILEHFCTVGASVCKQNNYYYICRLVSSGR